MKINDNGVIREMTAEEISADKEVDEFLANQLPKEDDKAIMEELIDRLSPNALSELKRILKDMDERLE